VDRIDFSRINDELARASWSPGKQNKLPKYLTVTDAIKVFKSPLLVDMYALTQSQVFLKAEILQGLFNCKLHELQTTFIGFYRKPIYGLNFAVAGGIDEIIAFLRDYKFGADELSYLESIKTKDGERKFSDEMLYYLNKEFTKIGTIENFYITI